MNVMLFLILVALILILLQIARMAKDTQAIRKILTEVQAALFAGGGPRSRRSRLQRSWGHPHGSAHVGLGFFTIWEWRDGHWKLKSAVVPPGVDPGQPPEHRGAFEGDHIKKWVAKS